MRTIGLVRDKLFLEHRTGVHHIETARRLEAINHMLASSGLAAVCPEVPARSARLDELSAVHTERHIEKILDTAGEAIRYLDSDTVTSEQSCAAAFLAAGGCIEAVDAVMSQSLDAVFACVRPPGHHAERDRQMGFCLFNNVAVAAEHARRRHGLTRILIVDWDVHHPNGTQHIFETTPEVLLFSIHRFPFFPGTGALSETGIGAGEGFTVNVPLPARATDADYAYAFTAVLEPVARQYDPELVLVSAGFDAHCDDPIGGMQLTAEGFASMTETVMRIADDCCGGKCVCILEGGYDLSALRHSVRRVLETMQGVHPAGADGLHDDGYSGCAGLRAEIEAARNLHRQYWEAI